MKYTSPEEEWKEVLKTNATAQRFASTLSQLNTYRSDALAAPHRNNCLMHVRWHPIQMAYGLSLVQLPARPQK